MFSAALTMKGNPRRLYFSPSLITQFNILKCMVNTEDEPNNPNLSLLSCLGKPTWFFFSQERLMGVFFRCLL